MSGGRQWEMPAFVFFIVPAYVAGFYIIRKKGTIIVTAH